MDTGNSDTDDPKHSVAVFALIRNTAQEILMIESPLRGWEFPGGHVEEGEDLIRALRREILEETGVKVEVGRLAGVYSRLNPPVMVLLGFLGRYQSGEFAPGDESKAVEWVEPDQVLTRISHPAIRDRVQDLMADHGKVVYKSFSTEPYRVHDHRYLLDPMGSKSG